MKEGFGPTTRSAKMAERDEVSAVGKKEKKRPRSESDAESDEDPNIGPGARQSGNGSSDQKRKRTVGSEAEPKRQIDRKKEGVGRFRKNVRIDKRRVREEPPSEEDPYEFKEDVEISKRKTKKESLKSRKGEIGRKRRRGGSIKATKDAQIDRKKVKAVNSKGDEGESEKKGAPGLGSKNAGSATRPDEECSGSSEVEKGTPLNLHISSGSVAEKNKGADWFDKKVFSVERVNDFRLVGISQEKHSPSTRKAIRKQGKDGDSKVLPNGETKAGGSGTAAKHSRTETEDRRKHSGSSSFPDRKAMSPPSFSGRKKLPEESGSAVAVTKNQKTGERKVRDMETEDDSGISPRTDSKNRGANSTSMTEVKNEGGSPLTLGGSLSNSQKEAEEEKVPGTEKQLVRAHIKSMLLDAGWTIDYRPRRNHNYSDSVYICPTGGSYWSIVKAYKAFREQVNRNDEGNIHLSPQKLKRGSGALGSNCKRKGRNPLFSPVPKKAINLLMRKTTGVMNKSDAKIGDYKRTTSVKEHSGSCLKKEKLKQDGKLGKGRAKENSSAGFKSKNLIDEDSGEMGEDSPYTPEGTRRPGRAQKPSTDSDAYSVLGRSKKHKGCALLVRSSNKEAIMGADGFNPYTGKRTVLSWMIDSGTLPMNAKVQYMNRRHTHAMLDGRVSRDGIRCNCCSKIVTVSDFEVHAGSKLHHPFQNIILDSGTSLLQCQLEAWGKQEESKRCGFHSIDIDGDDPDDDTCGICGDGGDLICCDSCPSTFHQSCLNIEKLPRDDWYCPNCTCKFCGLAGNNVSQSDDTTVSPLLSCSQCEEKYHLSCIQEKDAVPVASRRISTSFCCHNCRKLFQRLHKLLGIKNDLEGGFSWTLIQRFDDDSKTPSRSLSQRADCNSKIAVALAVMDECFLPIIDRRSGINVIHNALYNFGSNFNRLNYRGFYTAVLERDDEIISAASIRIHGTRLAEMPFIGTRHIYRRQGMCRRLLTAIEMALCSLNVEKLIIPAVSELMHTWTIVFGFKPLEESHRQEMRSMNMVVFPGTDLLQKQLLNCDFLEGTTAADAAITTSEITSNNVDAPEVENASVFESSLDARQHDFDPGEVKDKVAASKPCHQSCGSSAAKDKSMESASGADIGVVELETSNDDTPEVENASLAESSVDVHLHNSDIGEVKDKDTASELCHQTCGVSASQIILESLDVPNGSQNYCEGTVCDKSEPQDKSMESASDAAMGAVERESNDDDAAKVENASLDDSPVDVHLHDSDISEVKDEVTASEPCHQTCGVSASQMMLESLDVPDGSSSQNYGEGTVCDKAKPQDIFMESAFDAAIGIVELESNNDVAPKVENASLAESSVDVHLHDSDIGEVKDKVAASESCNQTSGVSASQMMLESLDVPNGSSSQTCAEGTVRNNSEPQDRSMESASDAAIGVVELESNNNDVPKVENAPLIESSVDAHLHDSDLGEVTDKVAASEPYHQTFLVSAPKLMVESLCVPSGSSSQTYGEGTVCDKYEPQDKSVESAPEAVVAVELESNEDCTPKDENASLVESSMGTHQHDSHIGELKDKAAASEPCYHRCGVLVAEVMHESLDVLNASSSQTYGEGTVCDKSEPQDKSMECASDAGEVKDNVAASEPCPQTCGASAAKLMLESLDVPNGSDSQPYVEGTVCHKREPQDKSMESASEAAIDVVEIESNNDDAPKVENASVAESSVDVHLHDSNISEVKDKVAASEPCNQTCGVSASQMMPESFDVPNGSSSQTCGEGTVCDKSEPQDRSMESASDAAIGAFGLKRNNDDATKAENAPLAVSSVDATSESCHQTCGASAAKVMVESFDVPSGSSSQTYGEGTICDKSEPQDKSVESVSDAGVGAVELESNKNEAPKSESASLAESSMDAYQDDSHIGEVKDKVAASEPCCHRFGVSAAEVMLASLDFRNGSTSQSYCDEAICDMSEARDKSMESDSDKGFLPHAGTRTSVENYSPVPSPVGPDQSSGEGELGSAHNICQSDVEVCRVESDLHALGKTCVQHNSEVINDALDVVSGSSFEASGGSISDKSQCFNSGASFTLDSEATPCEVASKSTTAPLNPSSHGFGENAIHDGHEVKVAAVEPNTCSFDKRPMHAFDTASRFNIQTSCESTMQHSREIITQSLCNSSVHSFHPSGECSGQQDNELVSEAPKHISDAALVLSSDIGHHDKQDVPNRSLLSTLDEPNLCPSSEATARGGTHEVNSDITSIEHDSHSLGKDSVCCTSEVASVSLNAAAGSEYLFCDKGRRFDLVCKPCDSSDASSHDLDVDSHNTSIVTCQSGGDLPAISNHHVSVDGTVPVIHEVKSVEQDDHGPLDASICHNTSAVASKSEIDIAAASRHDVSVEGSIPDIHSIRFVEPDHNGSVDASVCHDMSAVGSKSGGDFPTTSEQQVSTEGIMPDISGRGNIQLDDHGSLDTLSSHNAHAVASESHGDYSTASRHHVSAEVTILDIQGTASVKPDHYGSVGSFVCQSTSAIASESGGHFPTGSNHHVSSEGSIPDIHVIESVEKVCNVSVDTSSFHNNNNNTSEPDGKFPTTSRHHVSLEGTMPDIQGIESVELDHHGSADTSLYPIDSVVASESGGDFPAASTSVVSSEGTVPDIHRVESVELHHHDSVNASVCDNTCAVASESRGDFQAASNDLVSSEGTISDIRRIESVESNDQYSVDASVCHITSSIASESARHSPASMHRVSSESTIPDTQEIESVDANHHVNGDSSVQCTQKH